MTEKRYVTNDIVKFDYSEICIKSDNEMYTDTPLRNDEVIELLNENEQLKKRIKEMDVDRHLLAKGSKKYRELMQSFKKENEQLKKEIEINNEVVKIIKKHLPIGFVAGLEDKQIENTVKSILKELKEAELI